MPVTDDGSIWTWLWHFYRERFEYEAYLMICVSRHGRFDVIL